MTQPNRPTLVLTMGDAAGSGPELLARSLSKPVIRKLCRPLIIGDAAIMEKARKIVDSPYGIQRVEDVEAADFEAETLPVLDLGNIDMDRHQYSVVDPMCGKAAYEAIVKAVEICRDGRAAAMVTSAINKESLNKAGYHYDGHTGLLSELCGTDKVTMMLVADGLRICHVSTHVSLKEAIERVCPPRIVDVLRIADEGIRKLGIDAPRLAVAGLNPHAGEDGLFGDEESRYIIPAIEEARKLGLDVEGPFAGDTVFFRAWKGEFDGVLAMYHDQGHVAAKMLGIWKGVNVTLGLPIIRTSVEHGTDFTNAGKGTSDPRSLESAIQLAVQMAGASETEREDDEHE